MRGLIRHLDPRSVGVRWRLILFNENYSTDIGNIGLHTTEKLIFIILQACKLTYICSAIDLAARIIGGRNADKWLLIAAYCESVMATWQNRRYLLEVSVVSMTHDQIHCIWERPQQEQSFYSGGYKGSSSSCPRNRLDFLSRPSQSSLFVREV